MRSIDEAVGRAAGNLLGRTRTADVIDAALALLADDGDEIVTDDLEDFQVFLAATGTHVELVRP